MGDQLLHDIRATLMPGFTGFAAPAWLLEAFEDGLLSVCVYGGNVRDAAQLRALGRALRESAPHAVIALDEEGGDVTRLHYLTGSPYPGAAVLGRIDDTACTERWGARVGRDVRAAGFNLVLAPDADVNSNPGNPVIGTRSFGADPALVARHVAAWVRGVQASGVAACAKHFPGHGDTAQDSHLALPTVDAPLETLLHRELPPFAAAIAAGARTVMTSHILLPRLDPSRPATFSPEILQGLLRERLGFEGVIVSDALDMRGASEGIGIPEAAVRALAAGCDLLCTGTDLSREGFDELVERIAEAVRSGRLPRARVGEAAERVRALCTGLLEDPPASPEAREAESGAPDRPDDLRRVVMSFGGVATALEWLPRHPEAEVLRIETGTNMAVGTAPWGPFAAASHPLPGSEAVAARFAARRHRALLPDAPPPWRDGVPDSVRRRGVIAVGRGFGRHAFARDAVDALLAAGVDVLTVEMGWPDAGRGPTDVACYGASRLVGAALLELLEGGRP